MTNLDDVLLYGAAIKAHAGRLHGAQLHGGHQGLPQAPPEGVRLCQAAQVAQEVHLLLGPHIHAHAVAVLPHPAVLHPKFRRSASVRAVMP